jgi:hypothetical protein
VIAGVKRKGCLLGVIEAGRTSSSMLTSLRRPEYELLHARDMSLIDVSAGVAHHDGCMIRCGPFVSPHFLLHAKFRKRNSDYAAYRCQTKQDVSDVGV